MTGWMQMRSETVGLCRRVLRDAALWSAPQHDDRGVVRAADGALSEERIEAAAREARSATPGAFFWINRARAGS